MTRAEFLKAVACAGPGERIAYHVGFLCEDRKRNPELAAVAEGAWMVGSPKAFKLGGKLDRYDASGIGAGSLVQKRYEDLAYQYQLYMRRPLTALEIAALKKLMGHTFKVATEGERPLRAERLAA